jgi:hypothetical protein
MEDSENGFGVHGQSVVVVPAGLQAIVATNMMSERGSSSLSKNTLHRHFYESKGHAGLALSLAFCKKMNALACLEKWLESLFNKPL